MTETQTNHLYRVIIIFDTREYKDDPNDLIQELSKVVIEVGGNISKIENLGYRDFARVTNRAHPGDIYATIDFEGPNTVPKALADKLRLHKHVKRLFVESIKK